jgi:NAD(P)-dependent dehydrogenase (short-subunit alcohol dehydrogenase family)
VDIAVYGYNQMRGLKTVEELARKGDRVTIQFDDENLLKRIEEMAEVDERPVSRQIVTLVRAAVELLDEQGFKVIDGKLRKVSLEVPDEE